MTVLCKCGCGRPAPIAAMTRTALGHVKGEPCPYVRGHGPGRGGKAYEIDAVTGCWNWLRYKNKYGYGVSYDGTRVVLAHRMLYERNVGPIPTGLTLDHLCDNPSCVNPLHLAPATQVDNYRRSSRTKMNVAKVIEIRERRSSGVAVRILAQEFGITASAIKHIITRRSWRNVA